MRIEGVAYLPEPGEDPLGWDMPDGPIPLRVQFDPRRDPIGMATLKREEDGTITCTAEVVRTPGLLPHVPKFAVGLSMPGYGGRAVPGVTAVSVVTENSNKQVPVYRIVEDG